MQFGLLCFSLVVVFLFLFVWDLGFFCVDLGVFLIVFWLAGGFLLVWVWFGFFSEDIKRLGHS